MNETADKLMDLAEARIRNAGYSGFSFRDLAVKLGIKSAGVHHHFPTKAAMAKAVARRYGNRFLAAVKRRPDETPEEVISIYRSAFRQSSRATERCAFAACWPPNPERFLVKWSTKFDPSSDAASTIWRSGSEESTRRDARSMSWLRLKAA